MIASSNDQSPATYQNRTNVTHHGCNRFCYVLGTSFTTTKGLRGRVYRKEKRTGIFIFVISRVFHHVSRRPFFVKNNMRKNMRKEILLLLLLFFVLFYFILFYFIWRKGMNRRKNISFAAYRHRNSTRHLRVHLKLSLY